MVTTRTVGPYEWGVARLTPTFSLPFLSGRFPLKGPGLRIVIANPRANRNTRWRTVVVPLRTPALRRAGCNTCHGEFQPWRHRVTPSAVTWVCRRIDRTCSSEKRSDSDCERQCCADSRNERVQPPKPQSSRRIFPQFRFHKPLAPSPKSKGPETSSRPDQRDAPSWIPTQSFSCPAYSFSPS